MFIVLAPFARYGELFRESFELMREFRDRYHCMSFVSVYVKSIKSPYLAQGREDQRFCELMYYCGIKPTGILLEMRSLAGSVRRNFLGHELKSFEVLATVLGGR